MVFFTSTLLFAVMNCFIIAARKFNCRPNFSIEWGCGLAVVAVRALTEASPVPADVAAAPCWVVVAVHCHAPLGELWRRALNVCAAFFKIVSYTHTTHTLCATDCVQQRQPRRILPLEHITHSHRLVSARRHDLLAVGAELRRHHRIVVVLQRLLEITSDGAPHTHRVVGAR